MVSMLQHLLLEMFYNSLSLLEFRLSLFDLGVSFVLILLHSFEELLMLVTLRLELLLHSIHGMHHAAMLILEHLKLFEQLVSMSCDFVLISQ